MNFRFLIRILAVLFFPGTLNAQQVKTAIIDGKHYTGHLGWFNFYLLTQKGDTVLNVHESFFAFKFEDFNHDGYKDIYLDWGGNSAEKYSLYVFVPFSKKFKELKNFSDFPDAKPLKGTKYYYSYSKAGCADNTWISRLFFIENMTAVQLGLINGEGCGIKDGVYIYQVRAGKKTLFKTLPLSIITKYPDRKFGFIKEYWRKNYKAFL
jgi:hypothetical protein